MAAMMQARSAASRQRGGRNVRQDDHPLVDAFCEFHAEVVKQKRYVLAAEGAMAATGVQQHLLDAFEALGNRVGSGLSQHEREVFDDARYVMVAMADDVFCRLEWEGKEGWVYRPLEAIAFNTRDSGERFFNRLDRVLRGEESVPSQLLSVYLTALALGFQGRYAPLGTGEPETYRTRLAEYLTRTDPELVQGDKLCPTAYEKSGDISAVAARLPSLSQGFFPFLIVLIVWVILGEIAWLYRTGELGDVLDRIEGGL
jgi:type VI secretion system protein ImpK